MFIHISAVVFLSHYSYEGPTCKKMCDFSANSVFNLSAFEPSEDEMKAYVRAERERGKKKTTKPENTDPLEFSSLMDTTTKKKEFSGNLSDLSSDDDDDMPDIATLLKTVGEKGKKKQQRSGYLSAIHCIAQD